MFGLGSFETASGVTFPGIVVGDAVGDLRPRFGPAATTRGMLVEWDRSLELLHEIAAGGLDEAVPLADLRPLPPVQPIGQILCAGANYRRHVQEIVGTDGEQVAEARADAGEPFVFAVPASAMSGACDDIVLWGPGVEHDWELELAVVIGRRAQNVPRDRAMSCVAGYTMSNDISTRDVMSRADLPLTDFLMSKGRPGFLPTGPFLVPRDFIDDYRQLRISLAVNGQTMQDELVDDIIFGVDELVAYSSAVAELWPGDVLLTGSPGGNAGHHGNRWLRPGDEIAGEITYLGTMHSRCVAAPRKADAADPRPAAGGGLR
ncbi:MAG: fumarylacetoacetate hydrolase family protein [Actinobacteria bacterium]|nr:fumarylacetoacetate hydrolase family protein [Actinomycetota bacterium]